MSRIGKMPVSLSEGLEVQVTDSNEVCLKKKGKELRILVRPEIDVNVDQKQLTLNRKSEDPKTKAFHGLYRALIQNAVKGLSEGWSKSLKLNGVGYKAVVSGQKLELNLGYSHPISFKIPDGIEIKVEKQTQINISGADRQQVGQTAAQLRSLRPPEPYLGKGVRYLDEVIRKKAGKSGAEKK